MRESRDVSRKRRMTVLRQLTAPAAVDQPEIREADEVNHPADIHTFAADCRAQLPLRVSVTDERSGQSEELLVDRPFALVGSSETSDVRLLHPDVSRNHAYLQVIDGRVLCCDLASRSGTHWGEEIRSRGWMEVGTPIFVGPYSLRLVDNEFAEPPSDEMPVALERTERVRVPQANMMLTFLNARSRAGSSRVSRLHSPVTLVGWSHLCQLRLQHRSVGRVHCSLVWTPDGLWVVDLMCKGGTRVNHEWISFARLDERDQLEMGRFQLQVAFGGSGEVPVLDLPHSAPSLASAHEMDLDDSGTSIAARPKSVHGELRDPRTAERPIARLPTRPERAHTTRAHPGPAAEEPGSDVAIGDAATVSLMKQFAAMQQQMFDHTYQLLAVVTNAFQTAHNRQMDLIREELVRVHELNRELYELNRQRGTPEAAPAGPVAGEPPLAPALAGLERQLFPDVIAQAFQHPAAALAAIGSAPANTPPAPDPSSEPAPAVALPEAGDAVVRAPAVAPPAAAGSHEQVNGRRERTASRKKSAKQNGSEPPIAESPPASPAEEPRSTPVDTPPPEQDVHAWLSGRINELTQERSSRWQRILQLLSARS